VQLKNRISIKEFRSILSHKQQMEQLDVQIWMNWIKMV